MKKLKLNLDKEALQRFFLEHSEKLIFGAVVIGAGMIAFLAVSKASYDKTPGELQQGAASAKKHIESTTWEDVIGDYEAPNYVEAVNQSRTPIDAKNYALDKPFDPQIFENKQKRGLPANLLPVEKLRVAAGRGAFAKSGTAAAGRAGQLSEFGLRWVVITGVFNEAEQAAFFEEYYRDTQQHDPQVDVAQYAGYEVQRAEVTGSTATDGLQWQDLKVDATLLWMKTLDGKSEPLVEEKYLNPAVPSPLLPRHKPEDQDPWPPAVVHPLIPSSLVTQPETPAGGDPLPKVPGTPKLDPFGNPIPGENPLDTAQPEDDPDGDTAEDLADDAELQLKLFRFFDVLAKPGKTYRYRVRLLLKNPNFAMEVQYIEDDDYSARIPGFKGADPAGTDPAKAGPAELGASEKICTDWSQPSEDVVIPRDTRLLAVTVSPPAPGRESNQPTGKVMIINWVYASGIEAYKDFPVLRGKVINFKGYQFPEIREPREEKQARPKKGAPKKRVLKRPRDAVEPIDLDYMTESLVVDLRPGQRSSSKDPWPGPSEILVMNPDGSLSVHNELADLPDYEKRTMTEEDAAALDDDSGLAPDLPGDDEEDGLPLFD